MFDQIFLSPQVKRSVIISNKYDICELSYQLPNDLRLRKLGNVINISKILKLDTITPRSSHRRSSVKKGVLKNFAKFKGKHLCQSLFFKKQTLAHVFSCEFYETSKNTIFTEHLWTNASAQSSVQSSSENETFFNTSKNFLKNRN